MYEQLVNEVLSAYRGLLKREPELEGFLFWVGESYRVAQESGVDAVQPFLDEQFKNSEEYKALNG